MPLPLASLIGWSLLGASAAAFGALLGVRHLTSGGRFLGLAGASAAGMMLGVGYASLTAGLEQAPIAALLGAAIGVVGVRMLDAGPLPLEIPPAGSATPASAIAATMASALHSAAEGIAIGAAAAVDAWFGLFLIITFAIHNVSEGAVVGEALSAAGSTRGRAIGFAFSARVAQTAFAALAYLLAAAVPATLPWLLGASFGMLLYLIVAELLPQSYRQAGRTAIALVFSFAAGVVAVLGGRAH